MSLSDAWRDFDGTQCPAWVNPERIAYFEPRFGDGGGSKVRGTRLFFAEDGTLDVAEAPDIVLSLFAGDGTVYAYCHSRMSADEINFGVCGTCENARADVR